MALIHGKGSAVTSRLFSLVHTIVRRTKDAVAGGLSSRVAFALYEEDQRTRRVEDGAIRACLAYQELRPSRVDMYARCGADFGVRVRFLVGVKGAKQVGG